MKVGLLGLQNASPLPRVYRLQIENQPGDVALASIESAEVRPKVGEPQIPSASLVCSGPFTTSPLIKAILLQNCPPEFGIGEL